MGRSTWAHQAGEALTDPEFGLTLDETEGECGLCGRAVLGPETSRNRPRIYSKSTNNRPKMEPKRSPETLGSLPGTTSGAGAPKSAEKAPKKSRKSPKVAPPGLPKGTQNRSKNRSNVDVLFDTALGALGEPFGALLYRF